MNGKFKLRQVDRPVFFSDFFSEVERMMSTSRRSSPRQSKETETRMFYQQLLPMALKKSASLQLF